MKRNFIKEKLIIPTIVLLSVQLVLLGKLVFDHLITSYWAGIEIETLAIVSALFILVLYNTFYYFIIQDREKNEKYIKSLLSVGVVVFVIIFFNYIYQGMWLHWMLYFVEDIHIYGWKIYQYIYAISFLFLPLLTISYILINFKVLKGGLGVSKENKLIKTVDLIITVMFILYLIIEMIAFVWM